MLNSNRDTIYVCDCVIENIQEHPEKQYIISLKGKEIVTKAKPGQFVHLQVSEGIPMRRPISIMSIDYENDSFDILYKIIGDGTLALSKRKVGEKISVIGPIGKGFTILKDKSIPMMIGGGLGIPPIIAMSQVLKNDNNYQPIAILGSEIPMPFATKAINDNYHTLKLLDNWNIKCKLTSMQNYEGFYKGYVTDVARNYLASLDDEGLQKLAIYSCGPEAMLEAVSKLSFEFDLPCQVCLEEFMACAVGGCAGCAIMVKTKDGDKMQRVCVDGPVFEAKSIFS